MLNVVIPMAGLGSRFSNAGYKKPKPFIDVCGEPMIVHVMRSLKLGAANFILIARTEHLAAEAEAVQQIRRDFNAKFIALDRTTEGAACTVLMAHRLINNDHPLLMLNSDQVVDMALEDFVVDCMQRKLDGSILTFPEPGRDPKWSYVRLNDQDLVVEAKEKVALSDHATVGVYLFTRGRDFVESAIDMIALNERSKGEFYVAPVYNHAIAQGKRIGIYEIEQSQMHGLGTPEDLELYLKLCAACTR